jgi:hypothetical protein
VNVALAYKQRSVAIASRCEPLDCELPLPNMAASE